MMRLLPVLAALLLAACGGEEHTDIKDWMKEATKDVRGAVPPLPEVKPFPVVSYDAGNLLDPFRPAKIEPEKKSGGGGVKPDFDRRKEELERFPLDALRFVGLIRNDKTLFAVIIADKRVYRVRTGNYMGENFGRITDIEASPGMDEGKVILKEQIQDPSGDWAERTSILELQVQEARK